VIADVLNRNFVEHQLGGIREQLAEPVEPAVIEAVTTDHDMEPAASKRALADLSDRLPGPSAIPGQAELESDADPALDELAFFSRDPIVSAVQTVVSERLHAEHPEALQERAPGFTPGAAPPDIVAATRSLIDPEQYGPHDVRWITEVAKAVATRLLRGVTPFNPAPAEYGIADNARVILVGDWGTGLTRARAVASVMAEEVREALADNSEVHVIHLGDVYYSGEASEYEAHVLADGLWPVSAEDAERGVTSWSLNGNHDMYSGGKAYFETLLGDERFSAQRSADGRPTSSFLIRTGHWDLLGLDTSWSADRLNPGHQAVLEDPQGQWVDEVSADSKRSGRRVMLLSHHQLLSAYNPGDLGEVLPAKLERPLAKRQITAWFWGHEHRCMGFTPDPRVSFVRCIGHGGVPIISHPLDEPVKSPGAWEYRGFLDRSGQHWGRFGCAILDFKGERVTVRYRNDLGREAHPAEDVA
jgi:Calcineurin-like phosphoesterase